MGVGLGTRGIATEQVTSFYLDHAQACTVDSEENLLMGTEKTSDSQTKFCESQDCYRNYIGTTFHWIAGWLKGTACASYNVIIKLHRCVSV